MFLIIAYFVIHYDSGTSDPAVLSKVQITYKDEFQSHVHNSTNITVKSLTQACSEGGDSQPVTSTSSIGPLQPGYGEDAYGVRANCVLVRVNESHQLW